MRGWCSFWGLLHCDDRRSPLGASRDGPQHDLSRSGTVMISMNFNSEASLVIFFIIHVLFCFVFNWQNFTYHRIVRLCLISITQLRLKTFKTRTVYFVFSEDFRLCSRFNNVIYGAWHVKKAWFGSSVTTCRLACSEISLSIIEKKLERSPGKDRTLYNLADGLRALPQLYALYSHRERSFNQWQRASYPNFCYNSK